MSTDGERAVAGWPGRYYEDFVVGDVYRHPLGRTVTSTDNSWLTLLTQNTAALHFDAHYASQTSWRRPLVNSTFTLALVTGQSVTDVSQHVFANLGWDEVRLPAPVFEGDTIYSRSTVLEKRESGSRADVGIVRVRTEGFNQDGTVVISFVRTLMVYRRGHGPAAAAPAVVPAQDTVTPARSWLFVPADRPDRFDKAAASEADAIVLDLEDGVAPAAKVAARRNVAEWLGGDRRGWVRVGVAGSDDWGADLDALAQSQVGGLAGVVLPKAQDPADVATTLARLTVPVVALIETAVGVECAGDIARAPGVAALALGVADLGIELGLGADPRAWAYARSRLVVASRAAGLRAPIDGPTMQLDDPARTSAEAEQAREFGFGGKLCVHPRQAVAVNEAFARSAEEIAWARRVVAGAADAAGAVRVGDEMVDRPRLAHARAILADAEDADAEPELGS